MEKIVIQLQEEALSNETDILSLMRKAYFIARKLNLKEFEEWISNEQNGYPTNSKVPDYRKVFGEIKAWNPYAGWVPVVCESTTPFHTQNLRDSIASLLDIYNNSKSKSCMICFSPEVNAFLSKKCDTQTNFSLNFSTNKIYDIIEQVRNKILDWAITLEENGIFGEGLSFTDEEKNKASSSASIINYTNNFYSSVEGTQIQQDTTDSIQSIK